MSLYYSILNSCTFQSIHPGGGYYACFDVLNSQGTMSRYALTYSDIPLKTAFGQSGVAECTTNCWTTVITGITQPDGTSYSFLYDCDSSTGNPACNSTGGQTAYYGTLTQMTLPTGGTVTYTYANFRDALRSVGRWLTSKYASAGGIWSYYQSVTSGTTQQVTVAKPDYSQDVISFTMDASGGSFPTQISSYDSYGATLLSTVANTWDFSVACTLNLCAGRGHQDVRRSSTSITLPVPGGSITKQTTYSYDSPQKANVKAIKEWKYQPGTSPMFSSVPDRATYTTYATIGTNNDINRPLTQTVCNNVGTDSDCPGGGSKVAKIVIAYDAYGSNGSLALASVTGVVNHDDANFGVSYAVRGNATQVSQWVSGTTYLTTALSYDTTGQVVQVVDPKNNPPTTYSYADSFYDDTGADPPAAHGLTAPTNAYVTNVTDPIGTSTTSYYYGTGKEALATNYDAVTTYSHYMDPLDRPTQTDYPIGWALNQYHLPVQGQTQVDSYGPIGYTGVASASCTSCAHSQAILDSLGRAVKQILVNNPAAPVNINTGYDGLNRVSSTSHPNFGTTDPNSVVEGAHYDGLGRPIGVTHPDGQLVRVAYGPTVPSSGGLSTQQGSTGFYGIGFPIVSVDEAGKQKQEWLDGFGHVIEVDEPGTGPSNGATTVTVSGNERTTVIYPCGTSSCPTILYDSGYVSITVNGFTATAGYWGSSPTNESTASSVAGDLVAAFAPAGSPVTAAIVSGECCAILLQTKVPGAAMPSFSTSSGTYQPQYFAGSSFWASPSTGTFTPQITNPTATFYTYDALGNLVGVVQGAQNRSYRYDGVSRLTQESTPESGTVTLSYVTGSGVLCSGNPSNPCTRRAPAPNQAGIATVTTTYTYDTAGRLTQKTHSDATGTVAYTYKTGTPGKGLLATMTDLSGSATYTYDTMKRVTQVAKKIGTTTYTTKLSYNTASQLTKVTYPSGRVVAYNYDNVGHLCQVAAATDVNCNAAGPYLSLPSLQYDAAGRPLTATYANGVVATTTYSPQTFALTSLQFTRGTTTLFGLDYYYQREPTHCTTGAGGNNGQIQCVIDTVQPGRSASYTYDAMGRVLTTNTAGSSQFPAWGLAETYDRYGNRSSQTVKVGSGYGSSFNINPANNQITGFSYDAAGNVTSEPSPSVTFTYDGEECNTGYTGNGSGANYTCDGNHLRVQKVVTGTSAVTTVFVRLGGGQVIAEYDNGAAVASPTREYIYGNNLLATVTGGTGGAGGTIIYQQRDHLSARLFTDVNGNNVGEEGTYPFGEPWYNNSATKDWVFTTYERDTETGNDYALTREYANTQGRFLSPDRLQGHVGDPQSWNRYSYVENDPINLTDPSGEGFWKDLLNLFIVLFTLDAVNLNNGGWLGVTTPNVPCGGAPGVPTGTCTTDVTSKIVITAGAVACTSGLCNLAGDSAGGPGTGPSATDPSSTGSNPEGSNPSSGDPASQGPGSGGAGSADPVPGGPCGNDVCVGHDIWHKSAGCPDCGVIWGQSEDFVYWFMKTQVETAATLGVLSKVSGAVNAVRALPRMRISIGPGAVPSSPIHAAYEVGGRYLNGVGDLFAQKVSPYAAKESFDEAWHVFNVPIRNEAAVLATKGRGAWTCVGAALYAVGKGWLP